MLADQHLSQFEDFVRSELSSVDQIEQFALFARLPRLAKALKFNHLAVLQDR